MCGSSSSSELTSTIRPSGPGARLPHVTGAATPHGNCAVARASNTPAHTYHLVWPQRRRRSPSSFFARVHPKPRLPRITRRVIFHLAAQTEGESQCIAYRSVWLALAAAALPFAAIASSHREAPFITEHPKVDGTDFYMFSSYESGRDGYVTLIANYLPLQDAYGGPNYFTLDPNAVYDIHIDNDGDATEDMTFRFRFQQPDPGSLARHRRRRQHADGSRACDHDRARRHRPRSARSQRSERHRDLHRRADPRRSAQSGRARRTPRAAMEPTVFTKPVDNVGNKSIPDYAAYAASHVYYVTIPGCQPGKLFVGQRKEPFAVNLGEVFDLVNTNAVGPPNGELNIIDDKNVTSLILEVPISCLNAGGDPVIGGWTTASLPQVKVLNPAPKFDAERGRTQRLRRRRCVHAGLAARQSARERSRHRVCATRIASTRAGPVHDPQFLTYVTNPALPELLEALFGGLGVRAPNNFPRNDLVAVFLTGIPGL